MQKVLFPHPANTSTLGVKGSAFDSIEMKTANAVHKFQSVDSTMDMAKEFARKRVEEGTVILAETQTKGRGRSGREWSSPLGGLWFSLILYPESKEAPYIPLLAGYAAASSIKATTGLEVGLKWPNDVLINEKKVCGILVEGEVSKDGVEFVIVGVGINVNFEVNKLPKELHSISTTIYDELNYKIDMDELISNFLQTFYSVYISLKQNGPEELLKGWAKFDCLIGKNVRVVGPKGEIWGVVQGINEKGELLLLNYNDFGFPVCYNISSGEIILCEEEYKAKFKTKNKQ